MSRFVLSTLTVAIPATVGLALIVFVLTYPWRRDLTRSAPPLAWMIVRAFSGALVIASLVGFFAVLGATARDTGTALGVAIVALVIGIGGLIVTYRPISRWRRG